MICALKIVKKRPPHSILSRGPFSPNPKPVSEHTRRMQRRDGDVMTGTAGAKPFSGNRRGRELYRATTRRRDGDRTTVVGSALVPAGAALSEPERGEV